VLANLSELESINLGSNPALVPPPGLLELDLLDLIGQIHYTKKERTQAFLKHLSLAEKAQRAAKLDATHSADLDGLKRLFDGNDGFEHAAELHEPRRASVDANVGGGGLNARRHLLHLDVCVRILSRPS